MGRLYHIAKKAPERGSYVLKFTFRDSKTRSLTSVNNINSIHWWLCDLQGNIINGRSNVEAAELSNPYYLLFSDEDLQVTNKALASNKRIVTIKCNYDSDLGLGLDSIYAVSFDVQNLIIVDIDLCINILDTVYCRDVC